MTEVLELFENDRCLIEYLHISWHVKRDVSILGNALSNMSFKVQKVLKVTIQVKYGFPLSLARTSYELCKVTSLINCLYKVLRYTTMIT